ncbi:MAG: DNA mismatch repair endonuclease MutL [Armatimonadetes bacterium]|nr:DNA mismatch repair endonuclease MutL [Armatimonadota bacterium]
MSRIAILDEATIGQIAAGEVIERPASLVKELLENSLDAGARRIEVVCEEGGCRRVSVVDDGCGMEREDAVLALQPHATSKIRTARDLSRVRTLGFRGEALASIASVSSVELVTRLRGAESGARLTARAGRITDLEEVGAPEGTAVTVRDLFLNAPVRRRYLRSPTTEFGYISDCVGQYVIAHPEVALRLVHGGETALHHPGSGERLDAVVSVFGAEAARQVLPVAAPGETCAVEGFVSRPGFTRGTRAWQWFYANGRPVRSRALAHAVERAYHTLVPAGRFPVALLLFTLDSALVDVNVHPAKSEVRFLSEGDLHRFTERAVRQALQGVDLTTHLGAPPAPSAGAPLPEAADASGTPAPAAALPLSWEASAAGSRAPGLPEARAQIHDTYILAEGPQGLFIIDQHTAHERSLFEQLMSGCATDLLRPMPLTVPFVLSLTSREANAARGNLEALRSLGFALDPFGRDAFLVRSVPAALGGGGCETALRDTIEELLQEQAPQTLDARREKVAALLACRSAVKAGDRLTLQEMQAIVRGLYEFQSRFTCQHGRPTVILLSREELEKRFHRS